MASVNFSCTKVALVRAAEKHLELRNLVIDKDEAANDLVESLLDFIEEGSAEPGASSGKETQLPKRTMPKVACDYNTYNGVVRVKLFGDSAVWYAKALQALIED